MYIIKDGSIVWYLSLWFGSASEEIFDQGGPLGSSVAWYFRFFVYTPGYLSELGIKWAP